MNVERNGRGFEIIEMRPYAVGGKPTRLIQQSSAMGPYRDAFERPGSSYLWIGQDHHLDREEVVDLIGHLRRWVETGNL